MNNIETSLRGDENHIITAKVSMVAVIPTVILGLVLSLVPMFGLILAGIIIVVKIIKLKSISLVVTSKRIMGHYGIVKQKIMDAPLNKVNTVSVEKGLMASLFNYGTVCVSTSSGEYKLKYISSPNQIRAAIMEQVDIFEEEKLRMQAEQLARAINK